MVRSSLVSRRLNTISIFNPFDGESMGNDFKCTILSKVCKATVIPISSCLQIVGTKKNGLSWIEMHFKSNFGHS